MKLIADWKRVARSAWSVRLIVLAALLSGAEAVLPFFGASVPPWATFGVVSGALIARFVAQPKMHGGADDGA